MFLSPRTLTFRFQPEICEFCFVTQETAINTFQTKNRKLDVFKYPTSLLTKLGVDGGAAARDPEAVPGFEVLDILGKEPVESSFFVLLKYLPTDEEKF